MTFFALALTAIGVAAVEALDPITFVVLFKILATKKPLESFTYFIIPYSGMMFLLGVIILLFNHSLEPYLNQPASETSQWIWFAIGILIASYGLYQYFRPRKRSREKAMKLELGGPKSFIAGVILFFVNLPLSVAYIALILLVIKSGTPFGQGIVIMVIFTVIFTIPYVVTALIYKKYEDKIRRFLDKVFKFVGSRYVFGTILLAIGLYLILG